MEGCFQCAAKLPRADPNYCATFVPVSPKMALPLAKYLKISNHVLFHWTTSNYFLLSMALWLEDSKVTPLKAAVR